VLLNHQANLLPASQRHSVVPDPRACVQNLLSGNVTRVSTLRYGDAKTLPAIDVHLKPGFDAVPIKLLNGINVTYNTGEGAAVCWSLALWYKLVELSLSLFSRNRSDRACLLS